MSMLYARKDLKLHQNNCDMKHAKPSAKNASPLRMRVLAAALKSMPLIKTFTRKSIFSLNLRKENQNEISNYQ